MTPKWMIAAEPYLPPLNAAEVKYRIPTNLLVRIAFEESSFLPEVISGEVKSTAGAVGMMQLLPKYFPDAGQNLNRDIDTAAMLLANLYRRFGDWQLAVAAYNWGGGNVHHEMAADGVPTLADMPAETQSYVREIFADVPVAGILLPGTPA
jgi:soluble lytic murein transglycosylase-like protein